MGDTTFTFQVDEKLKEEFTAAAKRIDSSGEQLLRDFMHDFVTRHDYDQWFRAEVQVGLDEANAGQLIPDEEVEAEAVAWRAEIARKLSAGLPPRPGTT